MCSTAHIQYEQVTGRDSLSGLGNWAFDDGTREFGAGGRFAPVGRGAAQVARLALLLAISSVSSGLDPWFETQQQRSQLTMSSTFQTSSRRRITLRAALRLADEIMRRAEEGRLKAAVEEANRQFDLEDLT